MTNPMREAGLSTTYNAVGTIASATDDTRFLSTLSGEFNTNVAKLKENLDVAFTEIKKNASDPTALANYQAALAEYTLYRNAQSNAVKAYKDIDMAIVRNFN